MLAANSLIVPKLPHLDEEYVSIRSAAYCRADSIPIADEVILIIKPPYLCLLAVY